MPRLGNVDANVQAVVDAMAAARAGKTGAAARAAAGAAADASDGEADLVVFPELFLTGYNIGDDVQRLAFDDQDARLAPLAAAAEEHGVHLIVGAPRTPRTGLTRNSALCVEPTGDVTWIDKRALATFTTFREQLFFGRGETQPVWETRLGRFGIGICFDLYFPEFHKRQVLAGADVLVNISASPTVSRRFFETVLPARAIENSCFMLYSNNVGAQDGVSFWGGSRAYGPRAETLGAMEPFEEGRVVAEVDLRDLKAAREFRPTIRDSDAAELDEVERDLHVEARA